ncbi:MAG TPA: aminoacyl-histidine dipeptidase [Haloplasmataceae bacterium]
MQKLQGLKPERVFKHFEALTRIPRESGNERQVSDFLVQFARNLGLPVYQDDNLNVIIKKPATAGYEDHPRVILQGHMDMVAAKRDDYDFDFRTDPIPLVVDGDWIKTEGTTLGADNGIALAMAMAILEDKDLQHPELTVLFTTEEEVGMFGAKRVNSKDIEGEILINLDTEDEGVFITSCAGGVRALVTLPLTYQEANWDKKGFMITIDGLRGGHSGIEIDKHRANAILLMGRLLYGLDQAIGIDISHIDGGEKMNAIARFAKSKVYILDDQLEAFKEYIESFTEMVRNEYRGSDPAIRVTIEETFHDNMVFSDDAKHSLLHLLRLFPNGIQSMSTSIEDLVESSLNVGEIRVADDCVYINTAVRSSMKSRKDEIVERLSILTELTGAQLKLTGEYPEWEFAEKSPIRELMLEVYREMFHREAQVRAIHAGLECGYFKQKWPHIDLISIGPDIRGAHTPEERLSISSTQRTYQFLCEVLRRI